jgi:RNA polymerase sigma factor (sigma-70 family)
MSSHPRRRPSLATHTQLLDAARREDQAAVDELIRRYEPLVRRVVRALRIPPWCEREDLAQEARIGLLFAIRGWRAERGPFPVFAAHCVSNLALLALHTQCARKHQVLSRACSLENPHTRSSPSAHSRPVPLLEILAAPRTPHADPEVRAMVASSWRSRCERFPPSPPPNSPASRPRSTATATSSSRPATAAP